MIEVLIFQLHIVGAVYAFTKNWQSGGLKSGLMSLVLIVLVFFTLWAITGTLAYTVYPESWKTVYFNHNTLSLLLLFIPMSIMFYYFFVKAKTKQEPRKNTPAL